MDLWQNLFLGVVSGIVATTLWVSTQLIWAAIRRRNRFKPLGGVYKAYRKGVHGEEFEDEVTIQAEGNVLHAKGNGGPSAKCWEGRIIMSEAYPTSGTGHYHHTDSDGFGLHTVQRRDDDLLVHTEFVKGEVMVVRGYIWKKQLGREPI